MIEAHVGDTAVLRFPDGTDRAVIDRAVKEFAQGTQRPLAAPPQEKTPKQLVAEAASSGELAPDEGPSVMERIGRRSAEGGEMMKGIISGPVNAVRGVLESDPGLIGQGTAETVGAVGGAIHAGAAPASALAEKGMSKVLPEDQAQHSIDMAENYAATLAGARASAKSSPTTEAAISERRVVKSGEKSILPNPDARPPSVQALHNAAKAAGIDPTDAQSLENRLSEIDGTSPAKVTASDKPISQTILRPGGDVNLALEQGKDPASKVAHEHLHKPDVVARQGQPPEGPGANDRISLEAAKALLANAKYKGGQAFVSPEDFKSVVPPPEVSQGPGVLADEQPSVLPPELTEPVLREGVIKNTLGAASEIIHKVGRNQNVRIGRQVADVIRTGQLPLPEIADIMHRNGTTIQEFADEITGTKAGRTLNLYAQLAKEFGEDIPGAATREAPPLTFQEFNRRLGVIRAKLLASGSQIKAAALHGSMAGWEALTDTVSNAMSGAYQAAKGGDLGLQTDHAAGARIVGRMFMKNRGLTTKILEEFPDVQQRVQHMFFSDLTDAARRQGTDLGMIERGLQGVEKGVDTINWVGRTLGGIQRRAVFLGRLDSQLVRHGLGGLDAFSADPSTIPVDLVLDAAAKADRVGMSLRPSSKMGRGYVQFMNNLPARALDVYPTLTANIARFMLEHSPLNVMKLLSAGERAKLASGNMDVIARPTMGIGALLLAHAIHKEAGTDRWNVLNVGGKEIDLGPMHPFGAFLYLDHIITDPNYRLNVEDFQKFTFGARLDGGDIGYLMKKIGEATSLTADRQDVKTVAGTYLGKQVASFLHPLAVLRDIMAQFDGDLAKVRTTADLGFTPQLKAQLPIPSVARTLPQAYDPTYGPKVRQAPALGPLTGIRVANPESAIGRELSKYGFSAGEINPHTGDAKADNLVAKYMSQVLNTKQVEGLLANPDYKTNPQTRLKLLIQSARAAAFGRAAQDNPELFKRLAQERRLGPRQFYEYQQQQQQSVPQ